MSRAHVFLHASVKEGWGLVVLEAASQATPTVAFAVSGLRDTIINGKTGIHVTQRDPKLLGMYALKLVNNKEHYLQMQKNCLAHAASFTWDEATKMSYQLLHNVLRYTR
jgi:glycosyltransferase involved in cell wall biosynthesis